LLAVHEWPECVPKQSVISDGSSTGLQPASAQIHLYWRATLLRWLHAPLPDGSRGLGITLRYFDTQRDGWVVEFLNVTNSFIRRQVNAQAGAVEKDGSTVVVTSVSDESISREYYRVIDDDSFVYAIDLSNDGGDTWNNGSIEFTMKRVE
jgi:hypothetical protein